MAVFNLTFATTRAFIKVTRQALASDPLFQPDKTGPSRSADAMVLDAWGYQIRDFPIIVVQGIPGKNRRGAINDQVRPFFGVPLAEESGGTALSRTFDVPLLLPPSTNVRILYNGDATGMIPQPPFNLPVQQKTVGPNVINYVTLVGTSIGPPAAFPLANFSASTQNVATGQIFGGWFDMNVTLTGCSRSTQGREMLADRIMALVWFEKKRALRQLGIVVQDITHVGFEEKPYGADLLYYTKFNVAVASEFAAIAQYTESVQQITVAGTAVDVLT